MTHSSPSRWGVGDEEGRIGAGVGFGHRVARRDLAIEERLQEASLLLCGAVVSEDLCVPRVGRLTAEDRRSPTRAPEDLVEQCELHLAIALTTQLGSQMASPQALVLHLLLQRTDVVHRNAVALVVGILEEEVERLDLFSQKPVDPVELGLELWFSFEIPHPLIELDVKSRGHSPLVPPAVGCVMVTR